MSSKNTFKQKNFFFIWGRHCVEAALKNPKRQIHTLYTCLKNEQVISDLAQLRRIPLKLISRMQFETMIPPTAVHQGIAAEVSALPTLTLDEWEEKNIRYALILDQVTDPQNVGAIWRNAAAFSIDTIVLTIRNSPPLEGIVAKASAGALEHIPCTYVTNLSQTLDYLKKQDFLCVGLSEYGKHPLDTIDLTPPIALILGAEGKGMRQLTQKNCDLLAFLPTNTKFPTLNVSSASAVVAYILSQHRIRNFPKKL